MRRATTHTDLTLFDQDEDLSDDASFDEGYIAFLEFMGLKEEESSTNAAAGGNVTTGCNVKGKEEDLEAPVVDIDKVQMLNDDSDESGRKVPLKFWVFSTLLVSLLGLMFTMPMLPM